MSSSSAWLQTQHGGGLADYFFCTRSTSLKVLWNSTSEPPPAMLSLLLQPEFQKWAFSLLACALVGVAGVFPFFLFRSAGSKGGYEGVSPRLLNLLLSFAVGSLLGDAFLHLLPEAWERARRDGGSLSGLGAWVLLGIISFVICEKLANLAHDPTPQEASNNNVTKPPRGPSSSDLATGYFNLLANVFDNFTHGLAVAGSFIISPTVGLLTTGAILLHEIPHEIADFAILLRSGFDGWGAAKAQLSTAAVGLCGAVMALAADSLEAEIGNYTWWILPFTAGCFITISLNNLLPELLKEEHPKESVKQFGALLLGIMVMGAVSMYHV